MVGLVSDYSPERNAGSTGTLYDSNACGHTSNTFNRLKLNRDNIPGFCLNLITDTTNGHYDPDVHITVKTDGTYKADGENTPSLSVPTRDLSFDGKLDVYTFKFTGTCSGDGDSRTCTGQFKNVEQQRCLRQDGGSIFGEMTFVGACDDDRAQWTLAVRGHDIVSGGRPFSDVERYTIRHARTNNNYLNVNKKYHPLTAKNLSQPNRPDEHWIVEAAGNYSSVATTLVNNKTFYIRNVNNRDVLGGTPYGVVTYQAYADVERQKWKFNGTCTDGSSPTCNGKFRASFDNNKCLVRSGLADLEEVLRAGPCNSTRAELTMSFRGTDSSTGGPKFSIKSTQTSKHYLVGYERNELVRFRTLSSANNSNDHFIFQPTGAD